jgi:hypothetical protein
VVALSLSSWVLAGSGLSATAGSSGAQAANASSVYPTPIRHVFVLYFENKESYQVFQQGPFETYLAEKYAYAGEYFSPGHYSLPNYLASTSGIWTNYFSVTKTTNLGDLLQNANMSWKSYMESMPTPCYTSSTSLYDINHSPFIMYQDIVDHPARCDQHVVNLTAWNNSFANSWAPNYALVIPNVLHDGEDNNISVSDGWLKAWLNPLLNSTLFQRSVVFITYDEGTTDWGPTGNNTGGGHIYLAAVSPYSRMNYTSNVTYTHFNLLTTIEWLLGLGHTGNHDNWTTTPPMKDLFNFNQTPPGKKGSSLFALSSLPGAALPAAPGRNLE